ncbi:hypothetical protein [uncultured Bacteroides sp.]|uniref:hypothetical protein n=1 Tax=uncultured Bacteroides sp. TaxID=162156 RepID=UPI00260A799F|nr:hypothetical protein [uncultured Bacteroides sp.]
MRTTSKIIILAISIIVAIAAVMIYAKTQVEPPVASKHTNQYNMDLNLCFASFAEVDDYLQEDSIFSVTSDRISVFAQQNKLSTAEVDKNTDALLKIYVPLFLKRSFNRFLLSDWRDDDHNYMLSQIVAIREVCHTDGSMAVSSSASDSLSIIESIIGRYRKARTLARQTQFRGVANAQSVISQANQFAKDPWLSHCSNLVNSLRAMKSNIAQSHYNYIVGQVQQMTQYRYYSQDYYDNTIVPHVDAALTEYEKKAAALYGTRRNVDDLWARARSYYNDATDYYEN